MIKILTPWGVLGYITFKRTYSRRIDETLNVNLTEEFSDSIDRVIKACITQLGIAFTQQEQDELRQILLTLKGSVAGRFWWQLGTKTVNKLGLLSLQNCAFTTVDTPRAFTWAMDALMLGSGVGFNIQREFVYQLPKIKKATITRQDTKDADFIIPDSREGWIKLLDEVLKAHFKTGKGFSYSTILVRGKGTLIKGFGGVASGPEELCSGIAEISRICNARAGKKLRPIDCLDIMNVIGSIVVAGNVRRSAEIALGDQDDLQYLSSKRWDLGSIPNYRAMSNNSVICNDIETLPEQFWEGYKGNGEPFGLINLNLAKSCGRLGETQYPDSEVLGVNPCVAGDTEILTDKGYFRIDSLVGKKVNVWNGFEFSEVEPRITGKDQEMVTVTLSDGRQLRCTKAHKFAIANDINGYTSKKDVSKRLMIPACELEEGMQLIKTEMPIIKTGDNLESAYLQGFVSGDGMDGYSKVWIYEPKMMCVERLGVRLGKPYFNEHTGVTRYEGHYKAKLLPKSFVPVNNNLKSKLDWLAGYLDADGTYLKEGGIQAASVDLEFLLQIQKMLTTLGVTSKVTFARESGFKNMPDGKGGQKEYPIQKAWRLLINSKQVLLLSELGLKCERLNKIGTAKPNRDASNYVSIVSVEDSGTEDIVYCFTEPKMNLGCFEGIVTGQCAEQVLAPYETCCLAEIFLPNITSKEELIKVAKYLYRINKHSLALPCHLKETEAIVHKNMRMGIGVTGYLQATPEQRSWLSDTYTELRKYDVEYSAKNNWPTSIKLTTVKPSGTLSLLAGVTSGVHPAYSQFYIRRIRIASNSPLANLCRKHGYYSEYQKNFDGTEDRNTVVVSFPVKVPEGTVLAKDVTAIQQLEYVKELQTNWSDNAVSVTVYYKKEELEDIKNWLKKNYNKHVKSVSFLLHSDHGFQQAPLQEITKEEYEQYSALVTPITSGNISEDDMLDTFECVGGHCPIK